MVIMLRTNRLLRQHLSRISCRARFVVSLQVSFIIFIYIYDDHTKMHIYILRRVLRSAVCVLCFAFCACVWHSALCVCNIRSVLCAWLAWLGEVYVPMPKDFSTFQKVVETGKWKLYPMLFLRGLLVLHSFFCIIRPTTQFLYSISVCKMKGWKTQWVIFELEEISMLQFSRMCMDMH